MNIIAGSARNLALAEVPDCGVRPTAARARKALFDSLGSFAGTTVLDLFAGTGALALESASRGAAKAFMVECDTAHISCIRENCRRVAAAGAAAELVILDFDVMHPERYLKKLDTAPDIVFADPPYAESGKFFRELMANPAFRTALQGSKIVWEIPDTPGAMADFMGCDALEECSFRRFGGTFFLLGKMK